MSIQSKSKSLFSRLLVLNMAIVMGLSALTPVQAEDTRTKRALRNPIVKQAAIGAVAGTIGGALSGETSAVKGAGIGALTGAGTGLIDTSSTMNRKPLLKSTAKGAVIGTGVSAVAGRGKVKGAVVGAGVGAGAHVLNDYLNRR